MRPLLAVLLSAALAGPALADTCVTKAAAAQDALDESDLDADTRAAVAAMIEEGRALHARGLHDEAEETLQTALMMLGLM